jgi:shikimate kinase
MENKHIAGEKNLILIGFMGVGKTTIGEETARKLGRPFIDIDKEIEVAFGMPITQIFKEHGEKAFRSKEKELIKYYIEENGKILSMGGGAFLREDIRQLCLATSTVIFLDTSWEVWEKRMDTLIDTRPILQKLSVPEIKDLFYERKEIYSSHHLRVDTDKLTPPQTADYIIEVLKLK